MKTLDRVFAEMNAMFGDPNDKRTPDDLLDEVARDVFGRTPDEAKKAGICIDCGNPPGAFRDETSKREYQVSRLCQRCQDAIFGGA